MITRRRGAGIGGDMSPNDPTAQVLDELDAYQARVLAADLAAAAHDEQMKHAIIFGGVLAGGVLALAVWKGTGRR